MAVTLLLQVEPLALEEELMQLLDIMTTVERPLPRQVLMIPI
jgi:hypothetical protein